MNQDQYPVTLLAQLVIGIKWGKEGLTTSLLLIVTLMIVGIETCFKTVPAVDYSAAVRTYLGTIFFCSVKHGLAVDGRPHHEIEIV